MSEGEEQRDSCSNVFNYIKTRNFNKISKPKYKSYLGCSMSLTDLNTKLKLGFEKNTTDLNKRLGLESGNPQITSLFFAQNITLFEMESLRLKFKHLEDSLLTHFNGKNPFLSSEGECKQKIFYSMLSEDACNEAHIFLTELLYKIQNKNMIQLFNFYYYGIDDDEDFIRDKFTDINLSDASTFKEFYMLFLKTKEEDVLIKIIELIKSSAEPQAYSTATQTSDGSTATSVITPVKPVTTQPLTDPTAKKPQSWFSFGGSKKRKTNKQKSKKRNAKKNKSKRRV
jgi:hypothetical protein